MRITRASIAGPLLAVVAAIVIVAVLRRRPREGFQGSARFSTTKNPWGAAFSSDGRHLFVGGQNLVVYELRGALQPKLVRTVDLSASMGPARGLSLSPDGQVLVAGRPKHITFFSVPALVQGGGSIIGSIPVPKLSAGKRDPNPAEPTFSPDGTRVVCAIEYQNRAMVVDANLARQKRGGEAILGFIPTGDAPVGVAFFDNNLVGITSQKDSKVSGDGKCSGSLRIANYRTLQLKTGIPITPGCDAVRVVVGAKYIYVSSRSDNKIIKIDKSDTNKRQTISVGPNPVGIGLAPGGRLIVAASNRFSDAPGEINIVDTANGVVAKRIPGLKFPRGVAVSPDGKTAAVTYYTGNAVELLRL